MKINRNLCKLMKFIEYMGCICFEQRKLILFYILNIYTPHISVLQREINCLNRENENCGFRGNIGFNLQNTSQSDIFCKNLKCSHGQYAHFAPSDFPQTHHKCSVVDERVEIHVTGNKVNSKNMENGFGYEISASRLYHLRLVARVCLFPFSTQRMTRLYRN